MSLPADSPERIRELLTLYRESHYDVELARGEVATLRVGKAVPAGVRRWLGAEEGCYMTACNPCSQSLSPEENERRLESLRAYLRERDIATLEGAGHLPGESWREPSLLVRGLAESDIDQLARLHGQNGVLVLRALAPVALRIYRQDWRDVAGNSTDLEWA